MPTKIGFRVVSSSGEDEKFRASELNYHGPTARGWRSPVNCTYPQEIILQLKMLAILQQIQILAHQYLIPQKIEICTSSRLDHDSACKNSADLFEYLGFITFSDNKATGFHSRELKSITIPSKTAKYVKLRIHSNHENGKNIYNQVGLMGVNIIGDRLHYKSQDNEINNNFGFHTTESIASKISCNSSYVSPYDDLGFEMSVDQETVKIMKIIEFKMLQAIFEERLVYANALKITLENLRAAGEILGIYEQEKKRAINLEDYDRAKLKKFQIDNFRQKIYSSLRIDELLDSTATLGDYDLNSNFEENTPTNGEDAQIQNGSARSQFNEGMSNNHDISDSENSPSRTFSRTPTSQLIDTHCHASFQRSSRSPDFLKNHNFSTSASDSHICSKNEMHPDMQDLAISKQKLNASLEHVRPPSTESDSSNRSGSESPPSEKVQQDWSESLENRTGKAYYSSVLKERLSSSISPHYEDVRTIKVKPTQKEQKKRSKSTTNAVKSSFEAYEDRMLPALRSYHGNEVVRECQLVCVQQRKSTLNERERKQAMLPISVFGIEMVEKFYSKNFNDKEEGLKQLEHELKRTPHNNDDDNVGMKFSFNKIARAVTFLLHRTLRDKVYSVYSCAAETVRFFFAEYVPNRVSSSEVAKSVEKLLPELLAKAGDTTPRIHNMAAHTILSMAECDEVRHLNIIPAQLSRPLTSSVHPRLALSRLEMVEQLILNHGIAKEKKSGLTCRTLAEFGSSGLHHPAEAVRKVSERILIHVYKVNPRIVRKQLPPDDNVTRRNLLYRQLFQEFDFMDAQKKMNDQNLEDFKSCEINKLLMQNHNHKEGLSIVTESDKKKGLKDPNLETVQNLPSISAQDNENNESCLWKGQKIKLISPMKGKEKHLNKSDPLAEGVRFPSLTDSISTTKARLALQQTKCILLKDQTGRHSPMKKNSRPINYKSGIPVPTFGMRRKIIATSGNEQKKSDLIKSPKAKVGSKLEPKTRTCDSMAESKPGVSDIKKEMLETLQRSVNNLNKKEMPAEESIKFSDSMLTSIRENEFTESCLFKETGLKTCVFCLSSKKWTTEDSLNRHYLKNCMMLTTCEYCMEVTEISGFNNHLLVDCKWKHIFQKCSSCQEAILQDLYNRHECPAAAGKIHKTRCPFCHTNIEEGESSWRKHLTGKNTCSNHPRQKEIGLSL